MEGGLGADDVRVQKMLRRWGVFVGTHPGKVAGLAYLFMLCVAAVGWIPRLVDPNWPFINTTEQAFAWTVRGGKLEEKLRLWYHAHGSPHPWQKPVGLTMYLGKGDYLNKDILTREAFEEHYQMHVQFKDLKVTVQSDQGPLEYDIFDVCDRGLLPDVPGQELIMPCLDIGPLHCFAEQAELFHPTFQAIDPVIEQDANFAALMPKSYASRPSLHTLSDKQIKETLGALYDPSDTDGRPEQKRGCYYYTLMGRFDLGTFAGAISWDNGMLAGMKNFRSTLFLDAVPRIKYRLSLSKPKHTRDEDIKQALFLISEQWNRKVINFNAKSKYLEVANMEDFDYFVTPRMTKESNGFKYGYSLAGVMLLNLFCVFATAATKHPLSSRIAVAANGLILIGTASCAALGFYLACGLYFNEVIMLATPLLAFGIGADDMFVMIRYFSSLGFDFIATHTPAEVLGELLAQAGPGITLTSVCNACVFAVGSFFPIPAMADFCSSCAMVSAMNYILMMTLFAALMRAEASRVQQRQPELHILYFCQKRELANSNRSSVVATSSNEFTRSCEKTVLSFVKGRYAALITSVVGRLLITGTGLALMAVSVYLIYTKEMGYGPHELFPSSDPIYRAIELAFGMFSSFAGMLVFDNVDVAANQEQMLDVYMDLTSTRYGNDGGLSPWMTTWYTMMFYGAAFSVPPENLVPTLEGMGFPHASSTVGNVSYKYSQYFPAGPFHPNSASMYYQALARDRAIPDAAAAYSHPPMFNYLDMSGLSEFAFERRIDSKGAENEVVTLSFIPVFLTDLENEGRFVEAIGDYNKVIDKSPLKDRCFFYSTLVFWETFIELEKYLYMLMAVSCVLIFVVILLLFSCDIVTALITCLACLMIFVEILGVSAALMRFNIFVAALALMGLGMSVEFTAHLAAAFSLSKGGTTAERLGEAMSHSLPALFDGSMTTILCALPMAFHPTMFVVKYLFGIINLVVVIGFMNGCVVLPGMLAALDSIRGGKVESAPSGKDDNHDAVPATAPSNEVAPSVDNDSILL